MVDKGLLQGQVLPSMTADLTGLQWEVTRLPLATVREILSWHTVLHVLQPCVAL